jgi:hypothetical protein
LVLQLCILCLGLIHDGDVAVGVFPEREEILVGGERQGACHSQARHRSRPTVPHDAVVVEDLLKLGGGDITLSRG